MRLSNIAYALSRLLFIMSAAFVAPTVFAAVDGDGLLNVFLPLAAGMTAVGLLFNYLNLKPRELTVREGFMIVSLAWILLSILGALPFVLSGFVPSFTDAFFETMSGFTTTGATILPDIEVLPRSLLLWRSITHWLGGMGVIALAVALFPFLGVGGFQLFKAESPGPIKSRIVPRIRATAGLLWLVYLGMTAMEVVLLLAGGMPGFDAVCVTFGTMATGGFATRNASIAAYPSPYLQYVVIGFMYLAGANFALHYGLVRGRLLDYARNPEFRLYTAIILTFTAAIAVNRIASGEHVSEALVRGSLFQTVSIITTTGFVSENFDVWPVLTQMLLVLLMVIGGCSTSTGGGIKNVRVLVLFRDIGAQLSRLLHPRSVVPVKIGGRVVPEETVNGVMIFLALYLLAFIGGILAMLAFGLDIPSAIGATAATLGNVGPGLGSVGAVHTYADIHPGGKWVLSFLMMIGRLEILPVAVMLRKSFWR
jgi:trk system potassium uptake protein TrkH